MEAWSSELPHAMLKRITPERLTNRKASNLHDAGESSDLGMAVGVRKAMPRDDPSMLGRFSRLI
jgi:hypothetical protein